MAEQFRVVQCPVGELAQKLNELAGEFIPFVWHFGQSDQPSHVTVVFMRPPRPEAQMPLAVIPPGLRRQ